MTVIGGSSLVGAVMKRMVQEGKRKHNRTECIHHKLREVELSSRGAFVS